MGSKISPDPISPRRGYIDWLRGLAILVMIEAHVVDAWTRPADRTSTLFGWAIILGGFAAPLFLLLAGVGTALAIDARRDRAGGEQAGAAKLWRRGWQIFGYAFLFRLQSLVLNPGAALSGLLKVDILNIMGPAIALSGALLGRVRTLAWRLAWLGAVVCAFTLATPIVRVAPWLAWLPDPVEWYLRPQPGRATFTMFPWAGFLFAGTFLGLLIALKRSAVGDRRFHLSLVAAGGLLAFCAYRLSFLPALYSQSNFWTTSPTFFFMRVGILTMVAGLAYFWSLRPRLTTVGRYAPMERFGRSSLFVYWIHVEMVYGWFSAPLHRSLTLPQVALAFALFALALFGLAEFKTALVAGRRRRMRPPVTMPAR
ncbi:MAG: heparan-alpha-glucosaminide N-acetyltransferase domain-containing protein [Bacteroidales bacterium]